MKIKTFAELNEKELDLIIDRHFNHWVKFSPAMDLEHTIDKFKNLYANNDEIPFGIATIENDKVIGFCVLQKERLDKYPHFSPWITSMLIFEEFRGKGFGKKMVAEALNWFSLLGYKKVYLWTDQTPGFYKNLGFRFVQEVEKNEGGTAELFSIDI